MRVGLVVSLFLLATLLGSGCLGSDDDLNEDEEEKGAQYSEDTGAVVGTVLNAESLEPVKGAKVTLMIDTDPVANASAGTEGRFTLNHVEPGTYRLHVSTVCCHEDVRTIQVEAGQETQADFMLEPFADFELRIPYRDGPHEWSGIIECMAGGVNICQDNQRRYGETVERGIRTVTVGIDWEANPLMGATEFELTVWNRHSGEEVIVSDSGSEPFEITLDRDVLNKDGLDFDPDETSWAILFEVNPTDPAVYQQTYTIWWAFHYWDSAPSGFSTFPDG